MLLPAVVGAPIVDKMRANPYLSAATTLPGRGSSRRTCPGRSLSRSTSSTWPCFGRISCSVSRARPRITSARCISGRAGSSPARSGRRRRPRWRLFQVARDHVPGEIVARGGVLGVFVQRAQQHLRVEHADPHGRADLGGVEPRAHRVLVCGFSSNPVMR